MRDDKPASESKPLDTKPMKCRQATRSLVLGPDRELGEQTKSLAARQGSVAPNFSYLAFALRFIFPCAQRCFSNRDSFLRAAAQPRPFCGAGPPGRESRDTLVMFVRVGKAAMLTFMAHFPHPHTSSRAPRVCVTTSVSFSLEGKRIQGTLQVVSTTGGSARMAQLLKPGTIAEILLHTTAGQVSAVVEFMRPRRQGQSFAQAFRFLAFGDEDYARFDRTLQMVRASQRVD